MLVVTGHYKGWVQLANTSDRGAALRGLDSKGMSLTEVSHSGSDHGPTASLRDEQ